MQVLVRSSATNEGSDTVDRAKPRDIGMLEMGSMLGALAVQKVRSQVGLRLGCREVADGVHHGPGDFVKNFSKRVGGWLTAGIGPV